MRHELHEFARIFYRREAEAERNLKKVKYESCAGYRFGNFSARPDFESFLIARCRVAIQIRAKENQHRPTSGKIFMIKRLKKFFRKKSSAPGTPADSPNVSPELEARWKEWYERKSRFMEQSLGKQHNAVMHAIFPYAIGGGLDLYYYPNGIPGTAIATKELTELPNEGSQNRTFSCYELVMFTRHPLSLEDAKNKETAFGRAHGDMYSILNAVARYSAQASLNPHDTCEFPPEMDRLGGKCLVFDSAGQYSDEVVKCFGLLTVIEIFRSEMHFAMEHSGELLLEKLKAAGHYPYSDMDREPVA